MGAFDRVAIITTAAPCKPTDPDDEVFLLRAIDGQAHYLVSEDGALLALGPSYLSPVIGKSADLPAVLGA
jgi:predicted nucleic acid-binding protein